MITLGLISFVHIVLSLYVLIRFAKKTLDVNNFWDFISIVTVLAIGITASSFLLTLAVMTGLN